MNLTIVSSTLLIPKHTPIAVTGYNTVEAAVNTCVGLTLYEIPAGTEVRNAVITSGIVHHFDSFTLGDRIYLKDSSLTTLPANQEVGLMVREGQMLLTLQYRSTAVPRKHSAVGDSTLDPIALPYAALPDSLMVFVDIDYWEKTTEYTENLDASNHVTSITPVIPPPTGSLIRIQYLSAT
jgi:hypothetical protein